MGHPSREGNGRRVTNSPPSEGCHTASERFGVTGWLSSTIDAAHNLLQSAGYAPYYLYRQKFMAAGCENTGWCLPGHESAYNVAMMEELHSVAAAGAGAVTKLNYPNRRIERVFNPKYPAEYLRDIEQVIQRKLEIDWGNTAHAEF